MESYHLLPGRAILYLTHTYAIQTMPTVCTQKVLPAGIEPATAALLARRSNQLSYGSFCHKVISTS